MEELSSNSPKEIAGAAAAKLIQDGMSVGLGTGSTAEFFIKKLGERCTQGLKIKAVASSADSENLARIHQIPLLNPQSITQLDVVVDGADEIDPNFQLIKGGGGALLREKMLASIGREMIVIADESKLVDSLGQFPLPIEIIPFSYPSTVERLAHLGYLGKIRTKKDKQLFVTDNGNLIYDINLPYPCYTPEAHHENIKQITGVVETGLFINLATHLLIGYKNGETRLKKKSPLG